MRTFGGGVRVLGGLTLAFGVTATAAHAQRRSEPAGSFGLSLMAAEPQGAMGRLVDAGYGGQITGSYAIDPDRHVRLRADLGFLIYGHERQRYCFSLPFGCRIEADLTTTNTIFFGGMGPELVLVTGPVQPYLFGTAGFSYFATTSSIGGADEWDDDWGNTTNFDDVVFAWRAGGGMRLRVKGGRTPVFLDMAVERHQNGIADYLVEGDIEDHPDGSITLYPNRSEANLVSFRFGVTVGIPGSRGRHR